MKAKTKRVVTALLAVVMLLTTLLPLTASAADVTMDLNNCHVSWDYTLTDDEGNTFSAAYGLKAADDIYFNKGFSPYLSRMHDYTAKRSGLTGNKSDWVYGKDYVYCFCIERGIPLPDNTEYAGSADASHGDKYKRLTENQKDLLKLALTYGYPNRVGLQTSKDANACYYTRSNLLMSLSSHRLKILASVLTLCVIISGSLGVPMAAEEVNSEVIYNATRYIKSQVERATINGAAEKDKYYDQTNQWIYEEHSVTENENGEFVLSSNGEWAKPSAGLLLGGQPHKNKTDDYAKKLGGCMFYHKNSNKWVVGQGIAYYNNAVGITAGKKNGAASALTFVAPQNGYVTLSDPTGGKIAQLGYSSSAADNKNEFWTLKDKGDKIGVAIYKNDEKLWPENDEYSVLTMNSKPDFPTIENINVTENDKIRIAFIPLKEDFGYFQLNPQVSYAEASKTYGDFNSDQKIDENDLAMLRKYLLDLDEASFPTDIADLNADSNIDIVDLVRLKEYIDNPAAVKLGENN